VDRGVNPISSGSVVITFSECIQRSTRLKTESLSSHKIEHNQTNETSTLQSTGHAGDGCEWQLCSSEGAFIWVRRNSVVKGTEFLRFGLTIRRI
jgi:hypothetical protein